MSKFLDKEEIARLRAICDAATPGPWEARFHDYMPNTGGGCDECFIGPKGEYSSVANVFEDEEYAWEANAEFIAAARAALPDVIAAYDASEESRKNLVVCLLDAAKMWASYKERAEKAETALEIVREALEGAHAYVDDIVGWSGSSGNWVLQELAPKLRAALDVLPPKVDTKADK